MPPAPSRLTQHLLNFKQRAMSDKLLARRVDNAFKKYAVGQVQGPWDMEDRFLVRAHLFGDPRSSLYAVFDGHDTARAAQYCVEHFVKNMDERLFKTDLSRCLHEAVVKTDVDFCTDPSGASQPVHVHMKPTASGEPEQELTVSPPPILSPFVEPGGGTTACIAVIKDENLTIANVGDSRALLINRDGSYEQLTDDHKPDRLDERIRITDAGGTVSHDGIWRVRGELSMTRAIGDKRLKPFIISDPEIVTRPIEHGMRYLILGTDGLFELFRNEEIAEIVTKASHQHDRTHGEERDSGTNPTTTSTTANKSSIPARPPRKVDHLCRAVVEKVIERGEIDNTTVMLIDLHH